MKPYLLLIFSVFVTQSIKAQSIELLLQTGHSKEIKTLATSQDGNYFITGSADNTAKVWDISTGNSIKVLEGHSAPVNAASFSNDGMYIITASTDKTIKIWEFIKNPDNKILDKKYEYAQAMSLRYDVMTSGTVKDKLEEDLSMNSGCLQTYTGHKSTVLSVAFDPSMKNFISTSLDNTVKFWDPLLVKEQKSIPTQAISLAGFSADGKKYFTVENGTALSLWKFPAGTKTISLTTSTPIKDVQFSPDKKNIAAIEENKTLHVWDNEKGIELFKNSDINAFAFDKNKSFLLYSLGNELLIHDLALNKAIRKIQVANFKITKIALSGDSKFVIAVVNEKDILIIDYLTGAIKEYKQSMNEDFDMTLFSPNWENVLCVSKKQNFIQNTELLTGKTTLLKTAALSKSCFSPSSKLIATLDQENNVVVYENETLLPLSEFNLVKETITSINFSMDEAYFYSLTNTGILSKWNWLEKKKINSVTIYNEKEISSIRFINPEIIVALDISNALHFIKLNGEEVFSIPNVSSDASAYNSKAGLMAVMNIANSIEIWSISKRVKIKDIGTGLKGPIKEMELSSDGKIVTAFFPDGRIKVFETATGYETARRVTGKRLSKINPLSFSPNDKYIACVNHSNTIVLWNWKEDKEIRLINGRNGSIVVTSDNNYIVSNKGIDLISFKKGSQYYTFEQFDLHFNRPDKVMQQLGFVSEDKIKVCRLAYNKRLKKLGFINSLQGIGIHIPKTSIENEAVLPATTAVEKIILKIKATDTDYLLRSIMVTINGVPMHGIKGLSVTDKKSKEYVGEIEVTLSNGENKIKVYCMNEKGAESYKQAVTIICNKPLLKPNLYLTVIGVSEYKNASMNLRYAAKDGHDLSLLLANEKDKYQTIIIDTLFNEKATLTNILAMKQKLLTTKVDDKVILFIAGHGLLDATLDYYLATYDVDFSNPKVNGLPYEKMEDLLDGIPARNKLLMMDACHSGEVDKEEVKFTTTETKQEDVTFRAVPNTGVTKIGLDNSFEMMKQLFSDLRKGNGTTVISSAGGAEYAMEGAQWKNGVFTYSLISGLKDGKADLNKDGKIMLSEVQSYLQIKVPELTHGKQKPTSRAENISNDWQLW